MVSGGHRPQRCRLRSWSGLRVQRLLRSAGQKSPLEFPQTAGAPMPVGNVPGQMLLPELLHRCLDCPSMAPDSVHRKPLAWIITLRSGSIWASHNLSLLWLVELVGVLNPVGCHALSSQYRSRLKSESDGETCMGSRPTLFTQQHETLVCPLD